MQWETVLLCLIWILCMETQFVKTDLKSYEGYKVLRVKVLSQTNWDNLERLLLNKYPKCDVWKHPSKADHEAHIQVSKEDVNVLEIDLHEHGYEFSTLIEDIQKVVDSISNQPKIKHRQKRATKVSNDIIGTYATFEQIEEYLREVGIHFAEIASITDIGTTYQGNRLLVLKLGTPKGPSIRKPAIWIDGGMHAREWISPSSVMYMIYEILYGYYTESEDTLEMLNRLDFYFLPVANPDGYKFTKVGDRMWRKNRSPNANSTCIGTDLNRNYPFHWGEAHSYSVPCYSMFRGKAPLSELESKAISTFILNNNDTITGYISIHSYSQLFLSRWAYTDETIEDHQELLSVAIKAADAMSEKGGVEYKAGRAFELLYDYSGGSADWARGSANIKYSYTVELRDLGELGFLLPENYTIPVGEELWEGVKVVASHIMNISELLFTEKDTITFPVTEGTTSVDRDTTTTYSDDAFQYQSPFLYSISTNMVTQRLQNNDNVQESTNSHTTVPNKDIATLQYEDHKTTAEPVTLNWNTVPKTVTDVKTEASDHTMMAEITTPDVDKTPDTDINRLFRNIVSGMPRICSSHPYIYILTFVLMLTIIHFDL